MTEAYSPDHTSPAIGEPQSEFARLTAADLRVLDTPGAQPRKILRILMSRSTGQDQSELLGMYEDEYQSLARRFEADVLQPPTDPVDTGGGVYIVDGVQYRTKLTAGEAEKLDTAGGSASNAILRYVEAARTSEVDRAGLLKTDIGTCFWLMRAIKGVSLV